MRRDAQIRREALLKAAEKLFARDGYWIPLEQVAHEAGVGRGTLYRNFPDRLAIALAIFDRAIDRMEGGIANGATIEEILAALIRHAAPPMSLYQRLAADLPREGETLVAFEQLRDRTRLLLQPLADLAHREGTLRSSHGADELLLAVRMASSMIQPHMTLAEQERQIALSVALLLDGLRPA